MAKVELNIVALGDFSSVNSQIKLLQAQVDVLNKGVAGVGLGPQLTKDLASAQAAFKSTMLSTGQFTQQTVKMASETEKFGKALTSGKLKLSEYYSIITGKSTQAAASMAALAEEQVKLNNSVVVQNKNGFLDVYTPTAFNEVAQAEELVAMKGAMMQKAIEGGSTALINFGKNTQWAGRQLTVGLTMPMVMFGAAAVKSFQATNVELTRLQRLYGEGLQAPSQQDLTKISSQVLDLSTKIAQQWGISQTETVKTAANFAAMGKQGQDLLNITTQTERLSKLGGVDSTQATTAVVSLQNVYKVSTNQLADAVNFLSDMQKQTTMSLSDMTDAIPKVGPIMQQLGGSYKDTAVMLLAMREAGVPAAQSANALKSAMASLIAPTSAAVKEFQSFGINLNAIKSSGGPVQMIQALQQGLQNLSPLVREQLIEKLFGKFQFARISALIDNFGKAGSQTINALKVAGATSSQLADLANQEMKQATSSVSAQWTRALEGFKATIYPIGQKFVELGSIVLNVANKIGSAFNALPGTLKGFFGFLVVGAAIAGPLIMLTGLLSNFAGYILKTYGNIKKLATGGMTLKELLTPEIIASQKAAEIFSNQIVNDVDAVDLLNQAVKNLTDSLEAMASVTNKTNISGAVADAAAAAKAQSASDNLSGDKAGPNGIYYRYPESMYGATGFGNSRTTAKFFKQKPTSGMYISKSVAGVNDQLAREKGTSSKALIDAMTAYTGVVNDSAKMFKTSNTNFLNAVTTMKDSEGKALLTQEDANTILAEINETYKARLIEMEKNNQIINDQTNPLAEISNQIMQERSLLAADSAEFQRLWNYFNTTYSARGGDSKGFGGGGRPIILDSSSYTTATVSALKAEDGSIFAHSINNMSQEWNSQFATLVEEMKTSAAKAGIDFDEAFLRSIMEGKTSIDAGYAKLAQIQSQVFVKSGETAGSEFVTSIQNTINSSLPKALDESAIKSAAESAAVFEEAGATDGEAWAKGFSVSAETGAVASTGGLISKIKGFATGKNGMGMGMMLGGTILGQTMAGSSNSAINTAGSGITAGANAAGIAMMMGLDATPVGWIATGAAVATVAVKSLIKYMDDVKAHNAAVAASFQASSSTISAYGGNMITATQAVYNFSQANKESAAILTQTSQDVANMQKLGASDPLKQVGELLKGNNTASSVIGTVQQYAAAQVAGGMDPAKVSQMVTDLLTYAGKTQYLSQALSEITNSTKDMSTATTTWLNKLKNNSDAVNGSATSYSDLNRNQKLYADGLLQTTNIISDSSTPIQTVVDKIKSLSENATDSAAAVNQLALALANAGQGPAADFIKSLSAIGINNLGTIGLALKVDNAGFTNLSGITDKTTLEKTLATDVYSMNKTAADSLVASTQAAYDSAAATYSSAVAASAPSAQLTKAQQDAVNALGKEEAKNYFNAKDKVKVLDSQLTLMKLQTQELQAQQQYNLSQADLDNKIRMAQASGDFLGAALLQQQKGVNTDKYNTDTRQQDLQNTVDSLKAQIANDEQTISSYTSSQSSVAPSKSAMEAAYAAWKAASSSDTQKSIMDTTTKELAAAGLNNVKLTFSNGALNVNVISMPTNPSDAANNGSGYSSVKGDTSSPGTRFFGVDPKVYNSNGTLTSPAIGDIITKQGYKYGQTFLYPDPVHPGYNAQYKVTQLFNSYGGADPQAKFVGLVKKATGGFITGPGTSTSDSILARLSSGEFVQNAASVSKYGVSFMNSINNGTYRPNIPSMAGANSLPTASGAIGGESVYNINVNVNSNADANDIAKTVMDTIKRAQSMTSSNVRIRV